MEGTGSHKPQGQWPKVSELSLMGKCTTCVSTLFQNLHFSTCQDAEDLCLSTHQSRLQGHAPSPSRFACACRCPLRQSSGQGAWKAS